MTDPKDAERLTGPCHAPIGFLLEHIDRLTKERDEAVESRDDWYKYCLTALRRATVAERERDAARRSVEILHADLNQTAAAVRQEKAEAARQMKPTAEERANSALSLCDDSMLSKQAAALGIALEADRAYRDGYEAALAQLREPSEELVEACRAAVEAALHLAITAEEAHRIALAAAADAMGEANTTKPARARGERGLSGTIAAAVTL